jgi:serine/threonine-protein kinase RsbW
MKEREFLKVTLPNDVSYLPIIQHVVREMAQKFGFDGEDLYKIELGLEEAFTNVVKHAFEEGESGTFDVICERLPTGIKIILKEKGMPFDPKRLPSYTPATSLEEAGTPGLGTFLMKEAMDETSFHNLGPEGKEIHLIKHIDDYLSSSELASHEENREKSRIITEKIEFHVRRMDRDEAIEVCKGAYKSHGYTFFDEHIYYPEQMVALNESGEMVSVVAVTPDNTFMGHAALHYPYAGARIGELTFIFVNPEYRSQGCMGKMLGLLFETPKQYALQGVYAFAVTNHIFSQKAMLKHGLNDCGIELATSPSTWVFKGIEGDESQRISVALSFKYVAAPKPLTLYPPHHHRAMVEKLYKGIGANHAFTAPAESKSLLLEAESVIETNVFALEGNAEIFVKKYGQNVVREIKVMLRHLCLEQISAINLFLSLEDPLTYFMVAEFEKMEFFFSGIMPMTVVGDALILQYLNNTPVEYDKVVAYSDMAKAILGYIRENDPYLVLKKP